MTRTWAVAERLSRSATGELELARAHLAGLVAAARAVAAGCGHDADHLDCAEAGCRFADVGDGTVWCRLARRLERLDPDLDLGGAPDVVSPDRGEAFDDALRWFHEAVQRSLDAVRVCRQTGHAEGRCWFAPSSGVDGCGEVLRLAHRLG